MEYDASNNSRGWSTYMRIRVNIDVLKSLKKEIKLHKSGRKWRMVTFKYERLGTFSFVCGILGHNDKSCETLLKKKVSSGIICLIVGEAKEERGNRWWLVAMEQHIKCGKWKCGLRGRWNVE